LKWPIEHAAKMAKRIKLVSKILKEEGNASELNFPLLNFEE
jgi:hypothetical protein